MTTELVDDLEGQLARARQRRAQAALDGKEYDAGEIGRLKEAIETSANIQAERLRRQRAADTAARAPHEQAQRAKLEKLVTQFLEQVANAEAATRQLAQ
jgi:hypothetical protein